MENLKDDNISNLNSVLVDLSEDILLAEYENLKNIDRNENDVKHCVTSISFDEILKIKRNIFFDLDRNLHNLRKLIEDRKVAAKLLIKTHYPESKVKEVEYIYNYINNQIKLILGL